MVKIARVSFHNAIHLPHAITSLSESSKEAQYSKMTYDVENQVLTIKYKELVFMVPAGNIRSMQLEESNEPKRQENQRHSGGTEKKAKGSKILAKKQLPKTKSVHRG